MTNDKMTKNLIIAITVILLGSFGIVQGAFNEQINYQGKLTNSSNVAVSDGNKCMRFSLYTVASGGSAIWTEEWTASTTYKVTTTSGLFSVLLGSNTSLSSVNFNQSALYLQVDYDPDCSGWDEVFSPRKQFGAVPAAFEAKQLGGYTWEGPGAIGSTTPSTAAFTALTTSGNVGIGDTSPDYPLEILSTTSPQFAISNVDGTYYATFGVDSSGDLTILASGGDISLGDENLTTTGTGTLAKLNLTDLTNQIVLDSDGTYTGTITMATLSGSSKTWTLPNASGTVALGTGTASYAVYWSDVNTLTAEQYLSLSRGGTAAGLTASNGGIVYSDASALAILAPGTSGRALLSGGAGAPTWFAPTAGSVVFAGASGILAQDNSNFFWDDTNDRLGIGTTSPYFPLDILSTTTSQLALTYNVSNYTTFQTNSSGDLTITPSGGDISLAANLAVSGSGTHTISGTLDPSSVAAFTLAGDITGSGSPNISALGTATASTLAATTFILGTDSLTDITGTGLSISGGTLNFTSTEIGTTTWGSGSAIAWAFDASGGTDTSLSFGNNLISLTGNVGIGDTSPDYPLEILSTTSPQLAITYQDDTIYSTLGVNASGDLTIANAYQDADMYFGVNDGGTNVFPLFIDGATSYVGIGTTEPQKKLDVSYADSSAQLRLSQTGSVYGELYINSVGDLRISATGGDIRMLDENLWVCTGGACDNATAPATKGNLILETALIFDNDFSIEKTADGITVYASPSDAAILIFDDKE